MSALTVDPRETSPSLAAVVAAVDPSMPEFRARTSPDGMMTVVFTDIVGSTAMIEEFGEFRWIELMQMHNRLVRETIAAGGGEVVKSQGDGFMLVFGSATAAIVCAAGLQRRLARHRERNPVEPLPVRIGMHTGNVFALDEDFIGRSVVLAARITGQAGADEILVSSAVRTYTERSGPWPYLRSAELHLKGLATPERVHALDWRRMT